MLSAASSNCGYQIATTCADDHIGHFLARFIHLLRKRSAVTRPDGYRCWISREVGNASQFQHTEIRPILSMPISTNQPANSSLKCNTLKRLMCLHEY
jgi:hypothetical protein